ncbi:acyl-CoA thioesterase/bile acid-CoA:amino acid N-acyltransferase family protein [Dactylosporangium sp. NPDC050688]|uniref:acyl-CoA thioesterase/bile acid-CoA:amino acid N-acyltransferase family protein n=1 Tax=Dactylosporangium sp. NPDC050688 TaxID=3157217 RepID=UPI0033FA753D
MKPAVEICTARRGRVPHVRQAAGVRRRIVGLIAVVALSGGVVGCSARSSTHATIDVDAAVALADQPVHVRVSGLRPRQRVVVAAQASDAQGKGWRGEATFVADHDGAVDLDRSSPTTGTYSGTDGMGVFWSMRPATGDPDTAWFSPGYPASRGAFEVRLTVAADGREIGARTVTRQWTAAGVTHRTLTPDVDGMAGELFSPPAGAVRRPGVLLLGGSEGGVGRRYDAALLASHGYPSLALGYFGVPGLPAALRDVPLEYFVTAAELLRAQPGADPGRVVVNGYSRGAEAALLLAGKYPGLVRGTVLYAPNDTVVPGFPEGGNAWTIGGEPVPRTAIAVDRVSGPVLAVAGGEDRVWRSAAQAQRIMQRLDDAKVTAPHQVLVYPDAGHGVGSFPYLPAGVAQSHPGSDFARSLGGTRAADAAARSDGWPKVLAFLAAA